MPLQKSLETYWIHHILSSADITLSNYLDPFHSVWERLETRYHLLSCSICIWFICMLHSHIIHIQPYTYTCRNIVNTIMTNEHTSLEQYTSHFIRKGYVWEVSWRLNKDCNILTPSFFVFSSISFSFCWAAQPVALRAQVSAGSGSHCLELQQTDSNSKLLELPVAPGYIIVWRPPASVSLTSAPNSTCPQSRLSPDIFTRMHLLFSQVHFLFDSSARSEVNMLLVNVW